MKKVFTLLAVLSIAIFSFSQKKTTTSTSKAVTGKQPINAKQTVTTSKSATSKTSNSKKPVASTKPDNSGEGHNITLTLTPAKNQKAYLACYYGKGKAIIDSCVLDDKCVGHFKGNEKLIGGIYFVVSQAYSIQFELLIGDVQKFSVVADTTAKDKFVITGSPDNDLFKVYSKKSTEYGIALKKIADKLKDAKTKEDTTAIRKEYKLKNEELNKYRDELVAQNSNTLLAALLTTMKIPETPEPKDTSIAASNEVYRYVREHYFDDVVFADARLLRTPFFEPKIDDYFKYYISIEADSIIPEVKYMLLSARESKEMYAYLLTKFTNKYLSPEYMGQDKVFVHLFTDYYLKGDTVLLDAKSRKTIIDRGYSLMLNPIGGIAGALDLTDSTGKVISMYSLKSKYTVVAYWSPTCGHCRQEMPSLDSMYKAKWKTIDVKVYSIISKDDELHEMKKFLKEKNFTKDWYYTYETKEAREATEKAGVPNFRQAYDLNKTPIFYLLDADKRILLKNVTISQMDDFITRRTKAGK